jgi:hypothetical protein
MTFFISPYTVNESFYNNSANPPNAKHARLIPEAPAAPAALTVDVVEAGAELAGVMLAAAAAIELGAVVIIVMLPLDKGLRAVAEVATIAADVDPPMSEATVPVGPAEAVEFETRTETKSVYPMIVGSDNDVT